MNLSHEITIAILGWVIGLFIAMPVGPVAVLSVKRTLHAGWPMGVATGLGAAAADAFYAAIAAFGIYAVQDFLMKHQYSLRMVGGLVLMLVGARMLLQKADVPAKDIADDLAPAQKPAEFIHHLIKSFFTGLVLTITNPLTLMAFLAVMTNFGLSGDMHSYRMALIFVAGAFVGAACWWLSLVGGVTLIKARLSETLVAKINGVLAVVLVVAGIGALVTGYVEQPLGRLLH
jgi:threonine/homoserine/homoserine lactone efflux protein